MKLQLGLVRRAIFISQKGKDEQIGFGVLIIVLWEILPISYRLKKL